MSSLIVEVCKVEEIFKHPNADRLSVVKIKNWFCIVGLDQYKVGQLVVFVPPDSIVPNNLIEKYNLEYLKHNGRVGTTKLRGYLSQGLVMDLPEGNWYEGDDVSELLNITKWQPPEPKYSVRGAQQTSKKKINPNFSKYTDIENIKNYNDIFKDGDEVAITEKIHGCLEKKTKILLYDGTTRTIGDIVNNKLDVTLLGIDKHGNLCPSKIFNWYISGKTNQWLNIKYNRRGFGTGGSYFGSLKCTKNHKIYLPLYKKYVEANKLKVGDTILLLKNTTELGFIQKSVLTGKMLGDGSYSLNNNKTASITFNHAKKYEGYLDYTLLCLGDIAGNKQKDALSGYGTPMARARSITSFSIYNEFNKWIFNKDKKTVPNDIRLNPIVLAFWYMDDGSLGHHESQEDRVNLATCGFDEKSVDILVASLKSQHDISAQKYNAEGYWRIRLNAKEADKFFVLIAPYICPEMQYKLPPRFQNINISINKEIVSHYNILSEQKIIDIKEIVDLKAISQVKYDIETETNNFFANEMLVHNSNARFGNLEIVIGKNIPLLDKISMWIRKTIFHQKYEWVYGSHTVQITNHSNRQSFYSEDIWGKIAQRYNMKSIIPEDYIIYGEIFGIGIQDLTYGLNDIDLRVFDVKYKDKYLDWSDMVKFCEDRNLPVVPVLYIGKFSQKILDECTVGNSLLCPTQIREGCVVKMWNEESHPAIGRKILKSLNPDYLLRKNATEYQ